MSSGIALVCIDVDGTLVGSSGVVPQPVWPAAARLRARGVRLAICSGRAALGKARAFAERLDPEGWHIFQNGASVVQLPGGASRSVPLPAGAVDFLVARTKVARAAGSGRVLELYRDASYVVDDAPGVPGDRGRRHAELLGIPFAPHPLDALGTALGGPAVRAQWVIPIEETDAVVAEALPGLVIGPAASPAMGDSMFLNITAAGIDKASAVRTVADAYGFPMARVMMVGDGANDVAALRAVGLGVAMGNAEPAAIAAAARTVADVDEGGLVEALALAAD
ncbi:MAG TPA: HAD hydrolase family protein [Gemmatirosa sp.]